MADVLRAANDLVAAGLIEDYALGGALAAIYYVEPFTTYDADIIFVAAEKGLTAGIPAIYSYLQERGWRMEREHLLVKDFRFDSLPRPDSRKRRFAKLARSNTKECPQRSSVPSISSRLLPASDDTRIWRESSNYSNKPRSTERSWTTSSGGMICNCQSHED